MQFLKIKISDLLPASYNPRKDLTTQDREYQKIKKSIEEFGYVEPIIINSDNTVIGGHQRLKVLKELGHSEVDVIQIDIDKTKEKALNVALNKITGEWDLSKLDELFDDLKSENYDIALTGFDLSELDDLFPVEEKEIEEDDYEVELPEEPKSKVGEVYILGNHRLMCGDSTKQEDVERLMKGEIADMIFTDPPYGIDYKSNMRTKSEKFDVIQNDDIFISDWIQPSILYSNGWILFCTTWRVLDEWLKIGKNIGDLSNMIIWDKGGGGIGDLKHTLSTDFEIILAYNRGNTIKGKRIGSVWSIGKDCATSYLHPTQKPIALITQAIKTFSTGSLLDFFGGSGSTLIACEQLNRKCFMMELDPKYVDVIIDRWEKFTGKKAVKEE